MPARTAFEKRDPRDGCGGGITTTQVTQNVRPESCNLRSVHNVHHRIDRTRPQVTALGPSCDSGFASRPGPQGSCVNHPPRCVCWHVGYGHSKSKVLVTTITHMPAYGSSFGMLGTPSDDLMGSWESASSRFLRRRFDPADPLVSRGEKRNLEKGRVRVLRHVPQRRDETEGTPPRPPPPFRPTLSAGAARRRHTSTRPDPPLDPHPHTRNV